mmetsp:Transcript_31696/g.91306  ORF Transcript_31696/g.91306 Transcript_31696/m.91306 type:complete len:202 (+) Transcript_31696:1162-1767(+)
MAGDAVHLDDPVSDVHLALGMPPVPLGDEAPGHKIDQQVLAFRGVDVNPQSIAVLLLLQHDREVARPLCESQKLRVQGVRSIHRIRGRLFHDHRVLHLRLPSAADRDREVQRKPGGSARRQPRAIDVHIPAEGIEEDGARDKAITISRGIALQHPPEVLQVLCHAPAAPPASSLEAKRADAQRLAPVSSPTRTSIDAGMPA